jgi:hypothetical protein
MGSDGPLLIYWAVRGPKLENFGLVFVGRVWASPLILDTLGFGGPNVTYSASRGLKFEILSRAWALN